MATVAKGRASATVAKGRASKGAGEGSGGVETGGRELGRATSKSSRGRGGAVAAGAPARERGSARAGTKPKKRAKRAGPRRAIEILTGEEAKALIGATSARGSAGVRDRALLVVLYRAGLRIAEALALHPKDLDLATGDVRVLHGKGDKQRTVRIQPEAMAVVERWLRRREKLGISSRAPLFCTISAGEEKERGQPLDQRNVRHKLQRLAVKAGITRRVHPHGLRHTWASELAREGTPLAAISAGLGHTDLVTTQIYVKRLQPEEVLRALSQRPPWKP